MGDNLIGVGCIDNIDVERYKASQQRRCEGTRQHRESEFLTQQAKSLSLMVAGAGPRDQQAQNQSWHSYMTVFQLVEALLGKC